MHHKLYSLVFEFIAAELISDVSKTSSGESILEKTFGHDALRDNVATKEAVLQLQLGIWAMCNVSYSHASQ